jgi:uncharacterized protein
VLLVDVNLLVCAHREELPEHKDLRAWLQSVLAGDEAYGMSDLVLSGFLRVVTNPRVFNIPTPLDIALEFTNRVRSQENCVPIAPGPRHWGIFTSLCRSGAAKGTWCRMPIWLPWRSSLAVSGSRPTGISVGFPDCAGGIP